MSLVEISTVESDPAPIYRLSASDSVQDFLKAAGAESGLAGNLGDFDRRRLGDEVLHRVFDYGLGIEHTGSALDQRQFQFAQLGPRAWRCEHTFAQLARAGSPEIFKIQMLVVQLIAGKSEEGNCAPGAERCADDAGLFVGVDDKTPCLRSGQAARAEFCHFADVVRVVKPRFVLA